MRMTIVEQMIQEELDKMKDELEQHSDKQVDCEKAVADLFESHGAVAILHALAKRCGEESAIQHGEGDGMAQRWATYAGEIEWLANDIAASQEGK